MEYIILEFYYIYKYMLLCNYELKLNNYNNYIVIVVIIIINHYKYLYYINY